MGPDLVFGRLWKECGIKEVIRPLLAATTLTLSGPFISPCCIGFVPAAAIEPLNVGSEDYLIPGTEALELHRLYRAMAFLGDGLESKGPKTLGTPRCLKDLTPGRALRASTR